MGYHSFKAWRGGYRGGSNYSSNDWTPWAVIAVCVGILVLMIWAEEHALQTAKKECLSSGGTPVFFTTRGAKGITHQHVSCVKGVR